MKAHRRSRWRRSWSGWAILLLCNAVLATTAPAETRRLALVVGVNDGGPGREMLHYAVSDALSVATVLLELGGVDDADQVVLTDVDLAGLRAGLEELKLRLSQEAEGVDRSEFFFYYSGHADERGLLLGEERLTYRELRATLEVVSADLRVAVVDACWSGELTRQKGGQRRAPFLTDRSGEVKGLAIVTSSSADEVSQESDRIAASFFTHYLVTGLRGAADQDRDQRVTLAEAYQYTFDETLARTTRTRGGAQHPSYQMKLVGAGDLVLTDLRTAAATVILGPTIEGALYIRDLDGKLASELSKRAGQELELGLPAGSYLVALEHVSGLWTAELEIAHDQRQRLDLTDFAAVELEATVARGAASQLLQNLGQDVRFIRRFTEVAVVPGLSSNGPDGYRTTNHLSLSLLGGYGARLHGLALGLGRNQALLEVRGAQISGGVNYSGEAMSGLQLALGGNVSYGDLHGLQAGLGANMVEGTAYGAQLAPLGVNLAYGQLRGFQFGTGANIAHGLLRGAQLTLAVNYSEAETQGVQLGAGVNYARELNGVQIGLLNMGDQVRGLQLGLVNIGRSVQGVQIGLLNLAEEMTGAPVGVLSLARNGSWHAEVWADDNALINVGFKVGGQHVYTVWYASLQPLIDPIRWRVGAGIGSQYSFTEQVFANLDATAGSQFEGNWGFAGINLLSQLRLTAGYRFLPRLAVVGGVTVNVLVSSRQGVDDQTFVPAWQLPSDPAVMLWPGITAGLQF